MNTIYQPNTFTYNLDDQRRQTYGKICLTLDYMLHETGPQSFAHFYFFTGLSTADWINFKKGIVKESWVDEACYIMYQRTGRKELGRVEKKRGWEEETDVCIRETRETSYKRGNKLCLSGFAYLKERQNARI